MTTTLEQNPAVERAITRLYQNAAMGRADKVQKLDAHRYVVTSGTSGNQYLVSTEFNSCDCAAGQFGRLCRHRIAALSFERALQRVSSTPTAPLPPVRPAHVPETLWNRLTGQERRDVADGRLRLEAIPHTRQFAQYLDGFLIGTVRA